jgi:hypothetical protein
MSLLRGKNELIAGKESGYYRERMSLLEERMRLLW